MVTKQVFDDFIEKFKDTLETAMRVQDWTISYHYGTLEDETDKKTPSGWQITGKSRMHIVYKDAEIYITPNIHENLWELWADLCHELGHLVVEDMWHMAKEIIYNCITSIPAQEVLIGQLNNHCERIADSFKRCAKRHLFNCDEMKEYMKQHDRWDIEEPDEYSQNTETHD